MPITRVNTHDIKDVTIKNADVAEDAAIVDTKLDTISTPGKVSNPATTATASAVPNTILLRDASGNTEVNALHALQTVVAEISVRSASIEATDTISLTSSTPPVKVGGRPSGMRTGPT